MIGGLEPRRREQEIRGDEVDRAEAGCCEHRDQSVAAVVRGAHGDDPHRLARFPFCERRRVEIVHERRVGENKLFRLGVHCFDEGDLL